MRRALIVLAAFALAACQDLDHTTSFDAEAPVFSAQGAGVPGSYIVVFRDGVSDVRGLAGALTRQHGGTVSYTYEHAIRGFAAQLPAGAVSALRNNPQVAYIEEDQVMTTFSTTQSNATWGLDRIDQRNLPLSTTYTYTNTGAGVHAYIIDTGILLTHNHFSGRIGNGFDAVTEGGTANDCNGHGTHVAGTVGGTTHGVAKQVTLHPVRVLSCSGSGTTSGVIAGVDWVTANHVKPAVANMSLGGGASSTLDAAVVTSINAGVQYAIAAGNGNIAGRQQDACNYSPARVGPAMTISATSSNDAKASWANYGDCVDFFAPGVGITSAWHTSNTATNTISGTSMAAPHAAGVAALYLQANPGATPQQVRDALYDLTTKNKVSSSSTANNHLLYSPPAGFGGGSTEPVGPTANFTVSCTFLECTFTNTSTAGSSSIGSNLWTYGEGNAESTGVHGAHTYQSGGTYSVTLEVTDANNLKSEKTQPVTVQAAPSNGGGFTLSVTTYKVQGVKHADLAWSGAPGSQVDVFRDNTRVATVANSGAYIDNTGQRGGGSHTWRVCEAGTTTCSNNAVGSY